MDPEKAAVIAAILQREKDAEEAGESALEASNPDNDNNNNNNDHDSGKEKEKDNGNDKGNDKDNDNESNENKDSENGNENKNETEKDNMNENDTHDSTEPPIAVEKAVATTKSSKAFAVDPTSKVGVGIVPDISGPKITHPEATPFDPETAGRAQCSRCKKEYTIVDGKIYKLCPHCRELQRQRSKRWQMNTKLKDGACRRCGTQIPPEQSKYVLCPPCRLGLRNRKLQRYETGKCIHCSAKNDSNEFKVCSRCRNNDRLRRKHLEQNNCCNRCGETMDQSAEGRKVCTSCRSRKKTVAKVSAAAAAAAAAVATSHVANSGDDAKVSYEQAQFAQQAQQQAEQEAQADQQVAAQLETNLFAQQ